MYATIYVTIYVRINAPQLWSHTTYAAIYVATYAMHQAEMLHQSVCDVRSDTRDDMRKVSMQRYASRYMWGYTLPQVWSQTTYATIYVATYAMQLWTWIQNYWKCDPDMCRVYRRVYRRVSRPMNCIPCWGGEGRCTPRISWHISQLRADHISLTGVYRADIR